MRIIVPMAGMGKRMRPHTLVTPKPLFKIAGKPIVQRLVEDIARVCDDKIEEIAFIIGDFGQEVEENLVKIAESLGAKGTVVHQDEALGTAHAIMCAKESLKGNVIVAFADTLFKADFKLDTSKDGIIWVSQIDDPSQFGVVKLDGDNHITDFVEKPAEFVSDLAIIGIYFFNDGEYLREELQYLLDNKIMDRGEYQITDALENMKNKGKKFVPGQVIDWLDCGNKKATVNTNQVYLGYLENRGETKVDASVKVNNAQIIQPCYIGKNVVIENSVVGPHVSIGENTSVTNSVIKNSIIHEDSSVDALVAADSIIGTNATYEGSFKDLNISDYSSTAE